LYKYRWIWYWLLDNWSSRSRV